jgi:hypothetical protein
MDTNSKTRLSGMRGNGEVIEIYPRSMSVHMRYAGAEAIRVAKTFFEPPQLYIAGDKISIQDAEKLNGLELNFVTLDILERLPLPGPEHAPWRRLGKLMYVEINIGRRRFAIYEEALGEYEVKELKTNPKE